VSQRPSAAVRILRIAGGGDGVGRLPDGRTVFVPRTAPGDLVELVGVRPAKRFARARIGRILENSPERVEPPCPHYVEDDCGGCQLQHLAYPAQLAARRSVAGEALRRLARLDVPDPPIEPADAPLGYRTKLTLTAGRGRIGLHRYGRADDVFELEWCHITTAPLNELWQVVRTSRQLLPQELEQLVLRLDRQGGRHLLARVARTRVWTRAVELSRVLERAGVPAALWWEPEGGVPRVVAGRAGTQAPAGVFEQVHPAMGDRARAYAVAALGPVAGRTVWDLYAGVGDTTSMLARSEAHVESVELDRRAVSYAERTGPPAGRRAGAVEAVVKQLPRPDLVVTNPPRAGMDATVPPVLQERGPERIVYVSCDPATLARDIARLAPDYRLGTARCFDLFPQTAHVETVAVLERA
jgi:23S rRNA (uracil1939-C5)-methyltransferase